MTEPSTKPYLIRAIHEWCSDNGYRPHIAVVVDENTEVPQEFVRAGEIVLNLSIEATNRLVLGNDVIEFEARFNRVPRNISVPVANVSAIYAAENGHGMAFDVPKSLAVVEPPPPPRTSSGPREVAAPKSGAGSALRSLAPVASAPVGVAPVAGSPAADAPAGTVGAPVMAATPRTDSGSGQAVPPEDTPPPEPPTPRRSGPPHLTRVK
ncbi:MAG: ClpXP protease specificity-enhancing factor [Burkholderiales bacterium]|nr:ClpXP protease specificity-enhancing factor [Burkholderiales bacterium]